MKIKAFLYYLDFETEAAAEDFLSRAPVCSVDETNKKRVYYPLNMQQSAIQGFMDGTKVPKSATPEIKTVWVEVELT
jgi:hypothetical protein